VTGGFAPRFALEVAFLVLLALAAGLAELDATWIVLVMAAGWALVALVEWLAWKAEREPDAPTAAAPEAREDTAGWELDEILAPVPEDDPSP
jgi:hypothetical protein